MSNAGTLAFLAKLANDLRTTMALDAAKPAAAVTSSHTPAARNTAPRVLFAPKGKLDGSKTDAAYHGRVDTSGTVTSHFTRALRCRSSDLATPRYVAGEHKAIKAEGYYATKLYTEKALQREQEKGRTYY